VKTLNHLTVLLVTIVSLAGFAVPTGFAQESMISTSFPASSPKEKLHALQLTRFHFITLKQFHSALFSFGEDRNVLSNSEAEILNAGLNAFLSSPGRETTLLEALRQNKAIQLKFSVPKKEEGAYDVIDDPNRPLLYQLKPLLKSTPASIEVRPLLDRPVAFQITLKNGNEHYSYYVDWAGKITHLA